MKPNYEGKSGRSLLETSKVFNIPSFTISPEIFFILLSFRVRTVRLGHLSKSLNSLRRLKDRVIVSNFYDHGISEKLDNLFYFNSNTIRFLV
jgi:hypothetical protein